MEQFENEELCLQLMSRMKYSAEKDIFKSFKRLMRMKYLTENKGRKEERNIQVF